MSIDTFVFVYAKNGKIRCLTTDQAIEMDSLKENDWKHTATLNSVRWIEAMVNGDNADELINELKGETKFTRLERERDDLLDRLTALEHSMPIEFAKLERERDEARDAAEKSKSYKRVLKEDNAKLRRDLDKAQRDADTFLENFGQTQERAINAERELDELNKRRIEVCQLGVDLLIEREDSRRLLNKIFNLTQIGEPHPDALPINALQAIADMIDEHLKEARNGSER